MSNKKRAISKLQSLKREFNRISKLSISGGESAFPGYAREMEMAIKAISSRDAGKAKSILIGLKMNFDCNVKEFETAQESLRRGGLGNEALQVAKAQQDCLRYSREVKDVLAVL